jgi:hypothetical protein
MQPAHRTRKQSSRLVHFFKTTHSVAVEGNVFHFRIHCDVSTCHYTKYDCTGDLCSPMQIIAHQFALEQSIQSASLSKYSQSLLKCNNCRKCTPVDHQYAAEQIWGFILERILHIEYKQFLRQCFTFSRLHGISTLKDCCLQGDRPDDGGSKDL